MHWVSLPDWRALPGKWLPALPNPSILSLHSCLRASKGLRAAQRGAARRLEAQQAHCVLFW